MDHDETGKNSKNTGLEENSEFLLGMDDPFDNAEEQSKSTVDPPPENAEKMLSRNRTKLDSETKKKYHQKHKSVGEFEEYDKMMREIYAKQNIPYHLPNTTVTTMDQFRQPLQDLISRNPMFPEAGAGQVKEAKLEKNTEDSNIIIKHDDGTETRISAQPAQFPDFSEFLNNLLCITKESEEKETCPSPGEASQTKLANRRFRNRPLRDTKVVFEQNAWYNT